MTNGRADQPQSPDWIQLTTGPLVMQFDPETAFLRYVRLGQTEVLRGVYVAVRDHNWDTITPLLSNLRVERQDGTFHVQFTADCRKGPIDFVWRGRITGGADGTVQYTMDGEARSTFSRNRIGFCVLHPIGPCAGRACTIEKADGTTVEGNFPEQISPHQPIQNMRAIIHDVADGIRAKVSFEGDVFEMEDQRNWSDASFKTYCTPLELPFPVEIAKGSQVWQAVRLEIVADRPIETPLAAEAGAVAVRLGRLARLPRLGLGVASHDVTLSPRDVDWLRALRLDHLRVDVDPYDRTSMDRLARTAREAKALNTKLHVGIVVEGDAEEPLVRVRDAIRESAAPVAVILIFGTNHAPVSAETVSLARKLLSEHTPGAVCGTGTRANFTELNRNRLPRELDVVAFSFNPQVHAFDDASVMETLEAQPQLIASARAFCGDAALAVGPITLKQPFNPVATEDNEAKQSGDLPPQVDPRQRTPFAAAWTLGTIAQLARAGADFATFYETTGWLGVMETERGPVSPDKFPSRAGELFPLYQVFADLAECGSEVRLLETDEALKVQGLCLERDGRRSLLLANLTAKACEVSLPDGISREGDRVRTLAPHEITRIHAAQETADNA